MYVRESCLCISILFIRPQISFFFFNHTAPTEIYTLSLHDALPIWSDVMSKGKKRSGARPGRPQPLRGTKGKRQKDQKSGSAGMPRPISYAVFCLKKKKKNKTK